VFERYTERARRVLFFARHEAGAIGGSAIETEHLLIGLLREGKGLTSRMFERSHISLATIRQEIEARTPVRDSVATSVELPFSTATQRILQSAAAEADLLGHNHIGTEHLLLGILREPLSLAGMLLAEHGIECDIVIRAFRSLETP
jgi:ATP-dependent Clp protease ATP-binding subunit ClpC